MEKASPALPWRSVHLIGAGGVGMFGLGMILLDLQVRISGSDTVASDNLERLQARGAEVVAGHHRKNLRTADAVVYSSAIPSDNPELQAAREQNLKCYRRGCFLAELASLFETVVAVAGSHGKTTTAAMIVHILKAAGWQPGYLVGAEVTGWTRSAAAGRDRGLLVTEVDESDATQSFIHSDLAVVTNIDDDHCWSVGGEQALHQSFVSFAGQAGTVFSWDTPISRRLLADHPSACFLDEQRIPAELKSILPGQHNLMNASLAMSVIRQLGVGEKTGVAALRRFPGVQRRMSVRFAAPDHQALLIEDYAHHPTELQALLRAVRENWPDYHVTAIFQPHRFERVKRYAGDFSRILESESDAVVVVRPFSAWISDQQLADPAEIITGISRIPRLYWTGGFSRLAMASIELADSADEPGARLYLVIGAGDVGRVVKPLCNCLAQEYLGRLERGLTEAMPGLFLAFNRTWSALTTLGIGSARPLLAEPENSDALIELINWLNRHQVKFSVLGNGSNLVGTDRFESQLVIRLCRGEFKRISVTGDKLVCGAGVGLPQLVEHLLATGPLNPAFAGLAWIPGSLGGAATLNAGCGGAGISDFVEWLEGVDYQGCPVHCSSPNLQWGYRTLKLPDRMIITRLGLRLVPADLEESRAGYLQEGRRRRQVQPGGRSAGCVFRNPGRLSAGLLIERSGLSEAFHGDCRISGDHANFVLNNGVSTEDEFLALARRTVRQVYRQTGIRLLPEVCFAGEAAAELLKNAVPPPGLAVLAGGPSSERAVSLRSARAVTAALRQAGHKVAMYDLETASLPELPADVELVFPVLHGRFGEDGQVQQLLEDRGLSYIGSGPQSSRIMIDKAATKEVLAGADVPTPAWWCLHQGCEELPPGAVFPLVVKPLHEGSSMGISRVERPGREWRIALELAFSYSNRVLVEQLIEGVEITVGMVFGTPLPVVEIVPPAGRWFDYDAKYEYRQGKTSYHCPPERVSPVVQERARKLAAKGWKALQAKDIARFDFIVDGQGVPWCLEVNSIPGFTETSLLPKAAQAAGIDFVELCAGLAVANLPGWQGELWIQQKLASGLNG